MNSRPLSGNGLVGVKDGGRRRSAFRPGSASGLVAEAYLADPALDQRGGQSGVESALLLSTAANGVRETCGLE